MNILGKLKNPFNTIGQKFKNTIQLGKKTINKPLKFVGKVINKFSNQLHVDKIAKEVSKSVVNAESKFFNIFNPKFKNVIEDIYGMTPIGKKLNQIEGISDVISGRKDLSIDVLMDLIPTLGKIRRAIQLISDISNLDKQNADKSVQRIAKNIVISVLKRNQ